MFTIRNVILQDKQGIYSLIDAVNEHDQLGYSLNDEWFDYVIKEAGEHIFVAVDSLVGGIAAIATCMIDHVGKEVAQINIIVHPEYREQGIGTSLYNKVIKHLTSYTADSNAGDTYGTDNYAIARLEAIVKKRLTNSLRFVKKRGFKPYIYSWELQLDLTTNNLTGNSLVDSKYHLRLAADNDSEEYIHMMQECFGHQVDDGHYRQMFADSSVKLLFLLDQSQIVGMISIQYRDNVSTGYLFDIAIKEQYRGQGLGSFMISQAINIIKKHNMQKASLVVDGANKKALSLYEKLGFHVVDEDIIMVKYDILKV